MKPLHQRAAGIAASVAIALALAAPGIAAKDYAFKDLVIGNPYARATPPGAMAGGAFLSIDNHGSAPDRLLRVASPLAPRAELHEMSMHGGVMQMRAVDGIFVPAGKKVELMPGGYHVMLMALKAPLKAGDKFPLTLTFEKAGSIEVMVDVAPMGAPAAR